MTVREYARRCGLLAAGLIAFGAAGTAKARDDTREESRGHSSGLIGRWQLNREASEDGRAKLREAMQRRRTERGDCAQGGRRGGSRPGLRRATRPAGW